MLRILKKLFISKKDELAQSVHEIINDSSSNNTSGSDEITMLENLLDFRDLKVSEVMVPRTEIVSTSYEISPTELRSLFIESGHTRIPIYQKNLDDIIGFIHVKDLIPYFGNKQKKFDIQKEIRNVLYVPRSMKIIDLLSKMKENRAHIAIVLDEFGGTDGLVTIEDLIEEIVGDIHDEHDERDIEPMIVEKNDVLIVDARADVYSVEKKLNISLSEEDGEYETLGGFILSYLGYIPEVGTKFRHPAGISFEIIDAEARKIKKVIITPKHMK